MSPLKAADLHHLFQRSLPNPKRLLLIATATDGCPVGQICFDQLPLPVQDEDAESKIDLLLNYCQASLIWLLI